MLNEPTHQIRISTLNVLLTETGAWRFEELATLTGSVFSFLLVSMHPNGLQPDDYEVQQATRARLVAFRETSQFEVHCAQGLAKNVSQ